MSSRGIERAGYGATWALAVALTLPDSQPCWTNYGDENKNISRSQRVLRTLGSILPSVPSRMTNWWNNAAAT
jgi:hypothetical protein